ncbi:MAG: DedA family protein [Motiliproteus sp.]|nr:DedA family protein [Motiliproteus sp.]MCW9053880.1 DedA family protein [Motiliproteus sp.]
MSDLEFSWLGQDWPLWALFSSGSISSTLLPGGSEIYLGYLIGENQHPWWLLVLVATLGNTLGGLVTWGMGFWLAKHLHFDFLKPRQQQAKRWLQQRGYPALLLSWLPIIGDPLCLISGWLRMRFWWCALLILSGKMLRYVIVAGGVGQFYL